jgi:hypothetical protein
MYFFFLQLWLDLKSVAALKTGKLLILIAEKMITRETCWTAAHDAHFRWELNICDSSGQAKRFTPKNRGRVSQFDDLVHCVNCLVDLDFADD